MGDKLQAEILSSEVESSVSATNSKVTGSDSKISGSISKDSLEYDELKWNHALIRHPAGPCYKLDLNDKEVDEASGQVVFSRAIASGKSKYHSDLLHAIAADMNLDIDSLHENAQSLDLVYVNTLVGLLMETRVLTNSV